MDIQENTERLEKLHEKRKKIKMTRKYVESKRIIININKNSQIVTLISIIEPNMFC